jgi:hypothetical protein
MIGAALGRGIPWGDLDDHALYLTAVVAGLAALGVVVRRAWRAGKAAGVWLREAHRRLVVLERLVTHELNPNSGTSVKDALLRLEGTTERLEGTTRRVEARGLMVHGQLLQHIDESRAYVDAVRIGLSSQGIEIPDPGSLPPRGDDPPDLLQSD